MPDFNWQREIALRQLVGPHTCPAAGCLPCEMEQRRKKRVRWRLRKIGWRWHGWPVRIVDRFPEGTVYRVWCGWWLLTVMVKAHA